MASLGRGRGVRRNFEASKEGKQVGLRAREGEDHFRWLYQLKMNVTASPSQIP